LFWVENGDFYKDYLQAVGVGRLEMRTRLYIFNKSMHFKFVKIFVCVNEGINKKYFAGTNL